MELADASREGGPVGELGLGRWRTGGNSPAPAVGAWGEEVQVRFREWGQVNTRVPGGVRFPAGEGAGWMEMGPPLGSGRRRLSEGWEWGAKGGIKDELQSALLV